MGAFDFVWPALELTEEERAYWSVYRTSTKPGALRRCYALRLVQSAVVGEQSVLSGSVAGSGRKSLVHALTFSGDLQFWNLAISLSTGEKITNNSTGGGGYVPVGSLLNMNPVVGMGAPLPSHAVVGLGAIQALLNPPGMVFGMDPPIILEGAMPLQFDGQCNLPQDPGDRSVLNITLHVWELPESPTGSTIGTPPRERAKQYGARKP
jgi:hypothetical protein